jgi:very-short-patch-repair endonuclease
MEGLTFVDAVQTRYFTEQASAKALCKRWGVQFRSFRSLLSKFGIMMKSRSQACGETWISADIRRAGNAARMREKNLILDMTGDRNPSRRPEVRLKIAAAKRLDNAAKRPEVRAKMSAGKRAYYAAHPERHPNRRCWGRTRRSKIERLMDDGLRSVGIEALHGQRVGRRWPDLVILDARLIIECDGRFWHTPEADAARDAELQADGWSVLHFTDDQIVQDVAACAQEVLAWLRVHATSTP